MQDVKAIAERIRDRRTELGLSQEKTAHCLNVSWKTVASWEQGKTIPSGNDLAVVLAWLGEVQA